MEGKRDGERRERGKEGGKERRREREGRAPLPILIIIA